MFILRLEIWSGSFFLDGKRTWLVADSVLKTALQTLQERMVLTAKRAFRNIEISLSSLHLLVMERVQIPSRSPHDFPTGLSLFPKPL